MVNTNYNKTQFMKKISDQDHNLIKVYPYILYYFKLKLGFQKCFTFDSVIIRRKGPAQIIKPEPNFLKLEVT